VRVVRSGKIFCDVGFEYERTIDRFCFVVLMVFFSEFFLLLLLLFEEILNLLDICLYLQIK